MGTGPLECEKCGEEERGGSESTGCSGARRSLGLLGRCPGKRAKGHGGPGRR